MLNRNKALINFIVGIVSAIVMIVVFLTLANTTNGSFFDNTSGVKSSALSGIVFGISIIVFAIIYTTTSLPYADVDGVKRSVLPLILTILFISAGIAFSVLIWDYELNNQPISIFWSILIYGSITLAFPILIYFIQEFNTKFIFSSISKNRADEWEYNNFLNLTFNNIHVKHNDAYSELTYKGRTTLIKFISENIIERKIFLSGDTKSKEVIELESKLNNEQKGFVVYLSNTLPQINGSSTNIEVITNNDLFKKIKGIK